MYNRNLCNTCDKPIDPDMDDHAECRTCNAFLCNDNNSCIRDHMEYVHDCGYINQSPLTKRRRVKESLKGVTPEFIILDDPINPLVKCGICGIMHEQSCTSLKYRYLCKGCEMKP